MATLLKGVKMQLYCNKCNAQVKVNLCLPQVEVYILYE